MIRLEFVPPKPAELHNAIRGGVFLVSVTIFNFLLHSSGPVKFTLGAVNPLLAIIVV